MEKETTKKALVIFNPTAGVITKQNIRQLVEQELERRDFVVDIFILDKNFEKSISHYDFVNVSLVVAVGGDGTVKVAGRTIITNKLRVPLLIVPFGSANVTAVALNVPMGTKQALACLDGGKTRKMDVGLINKKYYFLVGLSIGYVSGIVTSTSRHLKNKFGLLGYVFIFIFNKIKISRIKFKIKTQNKIFWVKGNSLVVFNALNYFGLRPKKEINVSDGILNLYVFTNKTFFTLIGAFFHMLWHQRPKRYVFSLDNNYFRISINKGVKTFQIDGDPIKLGRDIEVEVLTGALEVITR